MKYLILILVFMNTAAAAQKNDYLWLTGDAFDRPDVPDWGGTELNFNANPISIKKRILPFGMFANTSSFCDDEGNLLFYTNGYAVSNRLDSLMDNGDSLNPNTYNFDKLYFGNGNWFGSIILPFKDKHYLFNTDRKKDNKGIAWPSIINYNLIDIKEKSGLGKVIVKNKILFDGAVDEIYGSIAACRHANGKDWWLLALARPNNRFLQYLVTEDTIIGPATFTLDVKIDQTKVFNLGQMFFSSDGTKFIYGSIMRNLFISDFDRCTGLISNSNTIETNYSDESFGGLMVSPSGRFLYANDFWNLYQFDLRATDIAASKVLIDTLDKTKLFPFEGKFMKMQLGPDGKIYMNCYNSVAVMHRINNPDEKGKACNFVQNDVKLATNNKISLPNFPNYRLGRLKDSPCDTIQVANEEIEKTPYNIHLSPNPASNEIQLNISLPTYDTPTEIVIVDVSGTVLRIHKMPDFAYVATIDISELASGVYGVQLRQKQRFGERVLAVEKLVVVR